jgi:phosphatidylinositol alpha-1,6-mannosyltransferase
LIPMKVLLLAWDFPPAHGGIQTWMFELARRLPHADVQVLAPAVPDCGVFDRASGCSVTRLRSARLGRVPWLLQLCATTLLKCLTWRPDVIVCGHFIAAPAAFLARRLLGVPYVVFAYGHEVRRKRVRRPQRFLLRNATLVVTCSRFTRSAVIDLGVRPERVRILYPGVDAQRFAPADGIDPARAKTILTVSRLADPYKGHDVVIRALPFVRARCPDVRYRIAGDGPLRDHLSRIAQNVGVEPQVKFLGEVADESLPDLYRSCDLFLLVSRESPGDGGAEGFGIVFLEAAACGKPVVAGRSGGIVDAVQDGVTGVLVDPEDVGAVADAIISVLRDPLLAKRLGAAGREMVLARFTWDHVIGEARTLFAEVVDQ